MALGRNLNVIFSSRGNLFKSLKHTHAFKTVGLSIFNSFWGFELIKISTLALSKIAGTWVPSLWTNCPETQKFRRFNTSKLPLGAFESTWPLRNFNSHGSQVVLQFSCWCGESEVHKGVSHSLLGWKVCLWLLIFGQFGDLFQNSERLRGFWLSPLPPFVHIQLIWWFQASSASLQDSDCLYFANLVIPQAKFRPSCSFSAFKALITLKNRAEFTFGASSMLPVSYI